MSKFWVNTTVCFMYFLKLSSCSWITTLRGLDMYHTGYTNPYGLIWSDDLYITVDFCSKLIQFRLLDTDLQAVLRAGEALDVNRIPFILEAGKQQSS